jgi:hypothetical protein
MWVQKITKILIFCNNNLQRPKLFKIHKAIIYQYSNINKGIRKQSLITCLNRIKVIQAEPIQKS